MTAEESERARQLAEEERQRTRRLGWLLVFASVLVVAIVVLHALARGDADMLGIAHRLEGVLSAVVIRTAMELAAPSKVASSRSSSSSSRPRGYREPAELDEERNDLEAGTYHDPEGGRYEERAGRPARRDDTTQRRRFPPRS